MLLKNLNDLSNIGQKGDWCFMCDNITMFIKYGDSWEEVCSVKIAGQGKWEWDGNKEYPTLSPSIKVSNTDKVLWHGYMRNGKLEEA